MSKILAFCGSNNSQSINKQLLSCAIKSIENHEIELINLEDFEAPIFGLDLERDKGMPANIKSLREKFLSADAFIFSVPEHNGSMPAFFKNYMDWMSRCDDQSIFNDKPVCILGTSPGGRGAAGVLGHLMQITPYWGAKPVMSFGLGSFYDKFNSEELTITSDEDRTAFEELINKFTASLG